LYSVCEFRELKITKLIPEWEKYGRGAGMIRNRDMIKGADYVVAFWDGKFPGTKNSINLAERLEKIEKKSTINL